MSSTGCVILNWELNVSEIITVDFHFLINA